MRIHGIHIQGLRSPAGEHRLRLDPGYNVLFVSEPAGASGIAALVRGALFPEADLGAQELWVEPGAKARAGLSLSFASDAYRIILDFNGRRMVLGRYVAESGRYERVSTDAREITTALRRVGLPEHDAFDALCLAPAASPAIPEAEPVAEPEPDPAQLAEAARREGAREKLAAQLKQLEAHIDLREKLQDQVRKLRRANERLAPLEVNRKKLKDELDRRAVLSESIDDLEPRIRRVQELEAERARERVAIEQSRRELLDERSELRGVPGSQDFALWIGVALMIIGAVAGLLMEPPFSMLPYIIGAAGLISASMSVYVSRTARNRLGSVEASLAALRVREREIERDFESETVQVRSLLRTLGHNTLEDLARDAGDYRALATRLAEVEQELTRVRAALPRNSEAEIAQLEERLTALADLQDPEVLRQKLAELSVAEPEPVRVAPKPEPVAQETEIDALLRASALMSGRKPADLVDAIGATLPVYLRLLSSGKFLAAARRQTDGWLLRGERRGDVVPFSSLPDPARWSVAMAFRLSLLEVLSPEFGLPLLLGPSVPLRGETDLLGLARALGRLGETTQVVQVATDKGTWADQAARKLFVS